VYNLSIPVPSMTTFLSFRAQNDISENGLLRKMFGGKGRGILSDGENEKFPSP
jgi:hypothetical protein